MSDWDAFAQDNPASAVPSGIPVVHTRSKWDDEEESDVADAWDAESEEEDKAPETPSASAAPKKRTVKQAIKERQEEEDKRKEELLAKKAASLSARAAEEAKLANETPAQRKARLQKTVEEADVKNMEDLFGGGLSLDDIKTAAEEQNEATLLNFTPKTKQEFEKYSELVVERFKKLEKSPFYASFLDQLARSLCEHLHKVEDVRKISSTLNALANEKLRLEKEAQKKGKKTNTKKSIRMDAGDFDDDAVDYDDGDYDDLYVAL